MSQITVDTGIDSADILGVRVHALRLQDLLSQIACLLDAGHRAQVMYANAHTLNMAYSDEELHSLLNRADIVYCDGAGVKLAAHLLGHDLPERMTGADWIHALCVMCAQMGYSLFLLGGEPGIAAQAATELCQQHPGLQMAGTYHGYYDHKGPENDQVRDRINAARADILLVGFGTPLQEKWIAHNFTNLNTPIVWAMGALLDFVAGREPRAPDWMLDHGLEWLGRLRASPRKQWRRYLIGNPLFLWRVCTHRLALPRVDSGG